MKKRTRAILLLSLVMLSAVLGGCRRTDYAENKAYAVMLGIDSYDNGDIGLTVRFPRLSGDSGGSDGSGGSSAYACCSAKGSGFQQAMENLKASMPREINLSALTMVVISETVVSDGMLSDVLTGLVGNYRMYSASYIAVCSEKASEFVNAQETDVGSRLSVGLKSLVENASALGIIPASRLADVYYAMNSAYGDPLIMTCVSVNGDDSTDNSKNIYSGSCAANADLQPITLDPFETQLVGVLRGDVKQFTYIHGPDSMTYSVDMSPSVSIKTGAHAEISVTLTLSAVKMSGSADVSDITSELRRDIEALVDKCRKAGIEPFGFAEIAAMHFTAFDEWIEYNWRESFKSADVDIRISVTELFG